MVAYIPAPALCQGADEDLIIEMGAVIFPGFVQRNPGANGLRLKLEGDYKDDSLLKTAADQFQALLGVLRAWRPLAGQRVDEVRPGIGPGSIRDQHGNQVVMVGRQSRTPHSNPRSRRTRARRSFLLSIRRTCVTPSG